MRLLVVAEPDDRLALKTAALWRARFGDAGLDLVTGAMLGYAGRLSLRLGGAPAVPGLRTPDGVRVGEGALPDAVLNRWQGWPPGLDARWSAADRAYALAERVAVLAGWLEAMPGRMVNRPTALAPGGAERRAFVWASLAVASGLSVADMGAATSGRQFPPPPGAEVFGELLPPTALAHFASRDRPVGWRTVGRTATAYVAGDRVFAPEGVPEAALLELARRGGVALLRCRFVADPWRLQEVDPFPPDAPDAVIAALVDWLSG